MASPNLLLNCFSVTLTPTRFSLPYVDFADYEASTQALADEYRLFSAYRYTRDSGEVRVVLLNGPERPAGLASFTMGVAPFPHFGARLIQGTVSQYFSSRGLRVSHEKSTTRVIQSSPSFSVGLVAVYTGIELQVRRPFESLPEDFVISAQWKASVTFRGSLVEASLRDLALGTPVLFKPVSPSASLSPGLRRFRNRYIGHVLSVEANDMAVVSCKDGERRKLPLSELFPEASPNVIRQYENLIGSASGPRSIWHRIQETDLVLTKGGRRNSSVLKDRLQAIRAFWGAGPKEELALRADCFEDGVVTIGLSPVQVEMT